MEVLSSMISGLCRPGAVEPEIPMHLKRSLIVDIFQKRYLASLSPTRTVSLGDARALHIIICLQDDCEVHSIPQHAQSSASFQPPSGVEVARRFLTPEL